MDAGRLEVQITPLIPEAADVDEGDFLLPTQVFDVEVTHPLNEGRTATASLSMHDPLVEDLIPWRQALRILYWRPGETTTPEPVFWGQANVIEDFEAGRVTLEAQDPSVRMQHHYARIGDDVLNNPSDEQRGNIFGDSRGIEDLIAAAQVPVGSGYPALGCALLDIDSVDDTVRRGIERGQEIWQMILDICESDTGPDFDMQPRWYVAGDAVYCELRTYERLGTDVSATVKFDYGVQTTPTSGDNMPGIVVTPGHPTTHAHVVDQDRTWRVTGYTPDFAQEHGMWVDWVATDYEVTDEADVDVLRAIAKARIKAYAIPPKQSDVRLRLDTLADFYYGHPDWNAGVEGDTGGDFYVGDQVRLRAARGYRSFSRKSRITQVVLSQPGARGPMQTQLTLIPDDTNVDVILDVDET